jgi:GNAT superfamily N-acetyltransferase
MPEHPTPAAATNRTPPAVTPAARTLESGYLLDTDPSRLDVATIVRFLTTEAYWARWRSPDDIRAQLAGSYRCVGCYYRNGEQAGFARIISDGVALGYLADVFVLPPHRGQGLGKALVGFVLEQGPGWRWLLHTRDAHPLYAAFGFQAPPETAMERAAPGR